MKYKLYTVLFCILIAILPQYAFATDNTPTRFDEASTKTPPLCAFSSSPTYTKENYDTPGKSLAGAHLQILDESGNVVCEWTTDGNEFVLNATLIAGKSYVLHEVTPPPGYVCAADIPFTVSLDGTVDKILMIDDTTKVELSKESAIDGSLIAGAHLQILDEAGSIVYEWTTDGSILCLEALLVAGATYTLHEVSAPEGYLIAEDLTFTVSTTGEIDHVVLMDSHTRVEITKLSALDGTMLSGAVLQVLNREGTVMDEWTTDGTVHHIDALLTAGETYRLHEVSAPKGYLLADDITFTVSLTDTPTRITMTNHYTQIVINKVSESNELPLPGAHLQVTSTNGRILDEWISDGNAHQINGVLIAGESYILKELSAPSGYDLADAVQFTVPEDEASVEVTLKNQKATIALPTGDTSNLFLLTGIVVAALLLAIASILLRRRLRNTTA